MSLPATTDNDIIQAMKTRFAAITAGANYHTTFANVYDNNSALLTSAECPAINLLDGDEETLELESSGVLATCKLPVDIDVVMVGSTPANVRKAKADVIKSIFTDLKWGIANCYDTKIIGVTNNVADQEGNLVANRRIRCEVFYRKNVSI